MDQKDFRFFMFGIPPQDALLLLSAHSFPALQVTLGYKEGDLTVTSSITDSGNVSAQVYHTPRIDLAAGVELGWEKGTNKTTVSVFW